MRLVLASLALLLAAAPAARADTTFGSDPAQTVSPLSCSQGALAYIEIFGTFVPQGSTAGSTSCMWSWSNTAVGTDIVPFPPTGGTGTVTSVTLPAMPSPGPMAVVVMTAALSAGSSPSQPDYACCQIKQVGPTFEIPANQVTTVSQELHVSATEEANLSNPGETSFGDLVGVAVLSPTASLPVRYTGATELSNFDGGFAYYPAPGGPNGEYTPYYPEYGFQLLARFTVAYDTGGGGGGEEPAAGGLKLGKKVLRVGGDGRTLALGKATNPPTATTIQKLTALTGKGARISAAKKPVVYGKAKTTVPAGKTRALKLKLNSKARRLLSHKKKLKAKLTVVATNAKGEKQTVTRTITVKPAKKKQKK